MLCKFSSCKIYYCKDIISKNFTVFLQDFCIATCLDIKSCIAAFFLQDSFLHFELLQEIMLSCKIYFLQDVCIKNLARLARYLQVLAQSCKTFLHGQMDFQKIPAGYETKWPPVHQWCLGWKACCYGDGLQVCTCMSACVHYMCERVFYQPGAHAHAPTADSIFTYSKEPF